jgi:hypothetical protein
MSRLSKVLVQLGLAVVLLLSFGAVGYDAGLNDDGDENLGIAVVVSEVGKTSAHQESARKIRTASVNSPATGDEALASGVRTESPLPMLGSPQLIVPLRT